MLLCEEIEASAGMPWTSDDVRSIAYRLIAWWDADRSHLRRAPLAGRGCRMLGGYPFHGH